MSGLILPCVAQHMSLPMRTPAAVPIEKAHGAEGEDAERLEVQELLGTELRADGESEQDRHDVHELVLRGAVEPLDDAALPEQVAEGQHADQRRRGRQERDDDGEHDQRKQDAFETRHGA